MLNDLGFMWFAMRTEAIENFIKELAKEEDPNDEYIQERIALSNNLELDILSNYEKEYIGKRVAELWHLYH